MNKISYFQIDAFTNSLFKGNPAGVCILNQELPAELMQAIAMENNLAETAFVLPVESVFHIRYFSPKAEVELCGHATLSAAHVLFNELKLNQDSIEFHTHFGDRLMVKKDNDFLQMTFPIDPIEKISDHKVEIIDGIHIRPIEVFKGKTDYLARIHSEDALIKIKPDFNKLSKLNARGLIVTAPGKKADFVSRFFAPQIGINEDYVTGSAHTSLVPYWSMHLNKTTFYAQQLSSRMGEIYCALKENKVHLKGQAKTYFKGTLNL